MKVGFLGLGRMGGAMVTRLAQAGHDIAAYDRHPEKCEAVKAAGAKITSNAADMARDRDVVFTMLARDVDLESAVLDASGLVASLPKGAIHVASGTHGVDTISKLAAAHKAAGQFLVAVAVMGRPDRAAEGKLTLVTGGDPAAVARLTPVLAVLGQLTFSAGPDPLTATAVKIAHNFILGCAIEAIGEGSSLVRKYDVDPMLFHNVLTQGLFNCIAYQGYGDIIAKNDWDRIGARAVIGLKDANLALDAAEAVGVPLPSANVWRDRLVAACKKGDAQRDWSVMAREQFRASGLE